MVKESDFDELGSFDDPGPEQWKYADQGDSVKGVVTARTSMDTKYGHRLCVILDTPDGPREVILGPAKLRRELAEDRDTQVGDKVAIRYEGEKDLAGGGTYKDFTVLSSRKKNSAGWDKAQADEEPPEAPDDPWESEVPVPF